MDTKEPVKAYVWWILAAIAVYVVWFWPHTETWDGDGEINVFPSSDSVKNYRLDAYMKVELKRHGWFDESERYSDIRGDWPNGGEFDISDCVVVKGSSSTCTDQSGKEYRVEVMTAPQAPESDSSE